MKKVNGFNPMNDEMKGRLAALAAMPDSEIDTNDIREWTEEDFTKAVPFHRTHKPMAKQISSRIDADGV